MMPLFVAALTFALCVFGAVLLRVHSRTRVARMAPGWPTPVAARYRPMLRLLNEVSVAGSANTRSFRARRRAIFRQYLRCLTRDYSLLLDSVRLAMTESGVNRPDLLKALARNRVLLTLTLCRIELALAGHWLGVDLIRTPDLSGLIAGIDALGRQMPALQSNFAGAR